MANLCEAPYLIGSSGFGVQGLTVLTRASSVLELAPVGNHPGDLQGGGWNAQQAKEECDQDQPESPSPATEDPDYEKSDEGRERNQKRRLDREAVRTDIRQGLPVDLRGQGQNRDERDPNKRKEADHQYLGAIEDRRET